jgi:hypothetical protein
MYEAPNPHAVAEAAWKTALHGGATLTRRPMPLSSYLPGAATSDLSSAMTTASHKLGGAGSNRDEVVGGSGSGSRRPTLQQHAAWGTSSPPGPRGNNAAQGRGGSPNHKKYHPAVMTVEKVLKKRRLDNTMLQPGASSSTSRSFSAAQKLLRANEEIRAREVGFVRSVLTVAIRDLDQEEPRGDILDRLKRSARLRTAELGRPFATDAEYYHFFEGLLLEELRFEMYTRTIELRNYVAKMASHNGKGYYGSGRDNGRVSADVPMLNFVNEVVTCLFCCIPLFTSIPFLLLVGSVLH